MRFVLLAATAAALAFGQAQAAPSPFTAKDMAMLDRASDPQISPDGRFVVFQLRKTDWDANKGESSLWLLDRTHPEAGAKKLASTDKASAPRWSPDGEAIYFTAERDGSRQLWRTDLEGAKAVQVTRLPVDVGAYKLSADGKGLVVALTVFPDCDTLACSKARRDARKADKSTGEVYDSLPFYAWDFWGDHQQSELFWIGLGADGVAVGDPRAITHGFKSDIPSRPQGSDAEFTLTRDGREVIFSALTPGQSQGGVSPEAPLWRAPTDGSHAPARLTPDGWSTSSPAVSADGRSLAFVARVGKGFGEQRGRLELYDLQTGQTREVAPRFQWSADKIAWEPTGLRLLATAESEGDGRLFSIDVDTGEAQALTGAGHVSDFSLSTPPPGAAPAGVYLGDSLTAPAQVFDLKVSKLPTPPPGAVFKLSAKAAPHFIPGEAGDARALTHVGEEQLKDVRFSRFERFSFPGWNGETVHGLVVEPYDYKPGRKYPVAFLIHGGPHGGFGDSWSYRWNPQVWAGMGYAVVMIDFHGSSGYGEAFAQAIVGHWGDRPLEDLQKGWAYALAKYPYLDGDRACALGGSYGGYMVAWIAGVWNAPWKCLVDHDGVMDVRTMTYSTDIPGFNTHENGGGEMGWTHPEDFERFNPIDHIGGWRAPILVVHSGKDYRVPIDQGLSAFTAAQLKGVPSELLYFPDENHWVLKPQNSVRWYATVEAWMRRWTGAADAAKPAR